jgi:ribosomal protein S4
MCAVYKEKKKKEIMAQMVKRRKSPYGLWLDAKQKVKKFYGKLTERQFKDFYHESVQTSFQGGGLTATDHFMGGLECRIDVLLYRSGLATSVAHAHQWVSHGKVLLNDRRVYSAGTRLEAGDCLRLDSSFASGVYGLPTLVGVGQLLLGESKTVTKKTSSRKLLSVASPSGTFENGAPLRAAGISKVVDRNFGGHFVVSPKLAGRRGSVAMKPSSKVVAPIAATNKAVYARVVAFCSRH